MRVLSVREWARAQGFGDSTEFISVQDSQEDVSNMTDERPPPVCTLTPVVFSGIEL
jgi:hypothetical protein